MAELVGFPELRQDLVLLQLPGLQLRFQPADLLPGGQELLVAGLEVLIPGAALLLQVKLGLPQCRQALLPGPHLQPQGSGGLCLLIDLPLGALDQSAVLLQPAQAGGLVALHIPADLVHVAQGLLGRLPLGDQARPLLLSGRNVLAELTGERQQFRLAGKLFFRFPAQLLRLGVLQGDFPLLGRHLLPAVGHPGLQGGLFPRQVLLVLFQALEEDAVVADLPLELEHRVLSGAALALGHLHLVPGGGQLPGSLLLLPLGGGQLLCQRLPLFPQGLQLVCPGQDARRSWSRPG